MSELGPFGGLAIFCVGTGVRPEEAFAADWQDVDLEAGVFTVRQAFAKGRLKSYAKTARSRRRVPLRSRVVAALSQRPTRTGIVFPASGGGRHEHLHARPADGHERPDDRRGHLARDADDQDWILLDTYDALEAAIGHTVGTVAEP